MSALRRSPMRRKPQPDPVTSEVRAAVMVRDRSCVLALLDPAHECRDQWGNRHSPRDLARMTLEHVKDQLRAGKRAESDVAHLVTLCWAANDRVPTKAQRAAFREYLARDGAVTDCGHVDPVFGCPGPCQSIHKPPRRA